MNDINVKNTRLSKKFISALSILLVMVMLMFIAVPETVSTTADAYNAGEYVLDYRSGYLYDYDYKIYNFTLSSESYIDLYFYYSTDGYYDVKIVNSSGNTVYHDWDYDGGNNHYVTLPKGSYKLYISENSGDSLSYAFDMYRQYNKTVKVSKVSLDRKKVSLNRYSGYYLTGTYSPLGATGAESWKSSNTKVATVTSGGYVYAKNFGKATITYKKGGKKAKCKIVVNKDSLEIGKGKSKSLKSWMKKVKGYKKAKWSSSNSSKVSVSKDGKIYTKKGGQATITAKIKGQKYKVKIYSYDKNRLKAKTKKAIKDSIYVPSSLKIQTIRFTDFKHCKVYFSAKNLYGTRIYSAYMGYYSYGSFFYYKVF